ncbi:tyrosine-protein phosphatase non-receptor type 13 isoform X2 [Denticeps clupeoides]|uniref:tyrosine-protein phosphatase non-receptor type 13 isoform X2 n=1 Tax=Denticeps clupeoides TaxID=299321 RepID=UPI0010A37C78|nr:FERM and PDZ domain-containing protein 2 isoform X2 [Denticeps clupeoides]
MGTFVTLAEVLEAKEAPLGEDEVWAILLGAVEALMDVSSKGPGSLCSTVTPGSVLLSTAGNIAFKSCGRSEDVSSFTPPEMVQADNPTPSPSKEKMVVFSLGMTLYWTVDYRIPQNQPVQLSDRLNSLLLSMCEDMVNWRPDLQSVLEACERHHRNALLPHPEKVIRQLTEDVLQEPVDQMSGNSAPLTDRSQMVRDKLRGVSPQNSFWTVRSRSSTSTGFPNSRSPVLDGHRSRSPRPTGSFGSSLSLTEKKLKNSGPEFVRMLQEPVVILELPDSIAPKKVLWQSKSCSCQRELRVLMPSGQCVVVKCDVKSRGGDVFDMIVAHSNLVEHFYFGLAYADDNEFFFLDNETKLSKVAPETWKKVPTSTFVLHFRVKYFVTDITLLLHKLTRHQYYLQLRKDILEDRLCCDEETGLFLAALALQAEYGDCMPEVCGKNFYRPEHYISKSMLGKMAIPCMKEELLRLHASNANMESEDSELEFIKTIQQLPEYGVLFHRVAREKSSPNEQILGVCAKGIIVYDVKNNSRTASLRFHWRENISISSTRRKFVIESSVSKKKHIFLTESSRTAKYLCDLCSAQHKFHKEMSSRQLSCCLTSDENIVQYSALCRAQINTPIRMLSCSEVRLNDTPNSDTPNDDSISKLCDDIDARIQERMKHHGDLERESTPHFRRHFPSCAQKRGSEVPSLSSVSRETPTRFPDREIICVSLKKDPKVGLGIVIIGAENTGRLDLGIFIASVVPGGPADRDGRIKAGGRLLSLNQTSLEGVTFGEAADIIQNSASEVELIVSQPKGVNRPGATNLHNYESQTTLITESRVGDDELDDLLSVMMTPKCTNRLHIPEVRILSASDSGSLSASISSLRPEQFSVELRKQSGSLGISIAGTLDAKNQNDGIYIRSLVPGGAAEKDGRIRSGDKLLEVDGSRLQGISHQQAAEWLAKTGEAVTLVLERESVSSASLLRRYRGLHTPSAQSSTQIRNNSCPAITMTAPFSIRPKDYSFVSDDNILEVTLKKRLNGLGFSFLFAEIDTSLDSGILVRIKTLFPGQPAEECGLIQEGDVILAVNEEPLKGLSYQRVLQLLRGSHMEVRLVLCRPAEGVLPPISEKIGQLTCS